MMQTIIRNSSGKVRPVVLGGIALLTISTGIIGIFLGKSRQGTATLATAATMIESTKAAVIEASLWELGCDPAALATLGVTNSTEIIGILQNTSNWLAQNQLEFERLRQSYATQRVNLSMIRRDLRRGSGVYSAADLRQSQNNLSTIEQALQIMRRDLRKTSLAGLHDSNQLKMDRIAALRQWNLDPEQQIVDCTEEDRLALARCRQLEDTDRTDDDKSIWARITGDSAYIVAAANRQVNEDAVRGTWNRFLEDV